MHNPDGIRRIRDAGFLAVVRADDNEQAVRAVGALLDGDAPAIELTFTTPGVEKALLAVRRLYGDAPFIGAGTIRDPEQVTRAAAAGARFLVTPNLRADVLEAMLASGLPAIPGVFTPTEVGLALDLGAEIVKLFPASTGGPAHLKALRGPFPGLQAIPTGGIGLETISHWFDAGAFAVGAGGEICSQTLIGTGNWIEITQRARRFGEIVRQARIGDAKQP